MPDPSVPDSQRSSPDDPVHPGDVLSNKFRVERVLGVGGMGVVVAATHLQLGQLVALKFMLPAALNHGDSVARFEREARAAVRLKSDHVAKVTDVGRLDNGAPYMVMEFLEGNDLDRIIRDAGPLPIATAVDYMLQACEAISEAHSYGIVHRDLKPKNLFLSRRLNGQPLVKVLDFGVSKIIGGEDLSLTSTQQILGSPSYMSPEQLRVSRDVDQRTDIWGLGAILYELLTGSVPFPAATLTQLTAMVITEPPRPIESLRADVPDPLRHIILKCLEKRAADRFQTVADFAAALAPFASAAAIALPTQRMQSSASHDAPAAPPADRPSFRAPGASTDVAWDRTQLATTADRRKARVLPLAAGAMVVVVLVLGIAIFLKARNHETPAAPQPTTSGETVATKLDPPLPTVRDPISPPIVSGVERPPPGVFTTQVPNANTGHVAMKRDAGVHVEPPASTTTPTPPPPVTTATGLPNTRN